MTEIGCYSSDVCYKEGAFVNWFRIDFKGDKRESLIDWLENESTKRQKAKARKRKSAEIDEHRQLKKLPLIEQLNDANKRVEEATANLKKTLLDKLAAEAELKVNDELNVVSPLEEKERMPILADPNNYTSSLHYMLDGVRGHLLVAPKGGCISIILTSDLANNLHYIENKY